MHLSDGGKSVFYFSEIQKGIFAQKWNVDHESRMTTCIFLEKLLMIMRDTYIWDGY